MKILIKAILSAIVFYYFATHILSLADLDKILREIRSVDLTLLANFFLLSLTNALISATRTLLMLDHIGFKCSFLTTYFVTLTRNLFSDLLPAKLGTLIYVWLLKRFLNVDYKSAFSAFFHITALDAVAVGFLILIVGGLAGFMDNQSLGIWLYLIAIGIVLVGLLFISLVPQIVLKFLSSRTNIFYRYLQETVATFVSLNDKGIFRKLLYLAVLQRFVKYFSYWILFLALVDLYGIDNTSAPFLKTVFAFVTAEMFVSLPIFTVAGVGAFQTGWNLAFYLLGFSQEIAVSTSFSHHLITQVWALALGATSVIILFLFYKILNSAWHFVPVKSVSVFTLCLVSISVLRLNLNAETKQIRVVDSLDSICKGCELYFDAVVENQTTGIYRLSGDQISKVVDRPDKYEQYPFFDEKNNRLIYTETPSLRRDATGRVRSLTETEDQILIENGLFASPWLSEGIIYERNRAEVLSLVDGKEAVLFPKDGGRYELSKVRASPSGKYIAFTVDKPSKWHVWIYDTVKNQIVAQLKGCEPWFKTDNEVVFVRIENQRRTIRMFNTQTTTETILIEPFDDYVTFYFPSVFEGTLFFSASKQRDANLERGSFDLFAYQLESAGIDNYKKPIKLISSNGLIRWPFLRTKQRQASEN